MCSDPEAHPDYPWLARALGVSARATCYGPGDHKPPVGCVLVLGDEFLGEGANRSPSGEPHCTDVGHLLDADGHCERTIHAALWALADAHERGRDLTGATAYLTREPCTHCLDELHRAGVVRVVLRDLHRTTRYAAACIRAGKLGLVMQLVIRSVRRPLSGGLDMLDDNEPAP